MEKLVCVGLLIAWINNINILITPAEAWRVLRGWGTEGRNPPLYARTTGDCLDMHGEMPTRALNFLP
jgi:hypothetical protein